MSKAGGGMCLACLRKPFIAFSRFGGGNESVSRMMLSPPGYCISQDAPLLHHLPSLNVDDFPPDFVLGAGTSAYQAEGAVAEDGRAPSVWDVYSHEG
ncbi:hypothetical protein ACLOJK_017837 [Asimina triloba]